jgi:hypothetical protein
VVTSRKEFVAHYETEEVMLEAIFSNAGSTVN